MEPIQMINPSESGGFDMNVDLGICGPDGCAVPDGGAAGESQSGIFMVELGKSVQDVPSK